MSINANFSAILQQNTNYFRPALRPFALAFRALMDETNFDTPLKINGKAMLSSVPTNPTVCKTLRCPAHVLALVAALKFFFIFFKFFYFEGGKWDHPVYGI